MKWRQRTTTDDNWRLLQFLNQFSAQVTTLHRTTWRLDDIVTAQVTTHEDLLTTQVMAREDLLTTKLKALDDILTTVHDDTDDLLDDTDNLYMIYKQYIIYTIPTIHVCVFYFYCFTPALQLWVTTRNELNHCASSSLSFPSQQPTKPVLLPLRWPSNSEVPFTNLFAVN